MPAGESLLWHEPTISGRGFCGTSPEDASLSIQGLLNPVRHFGGVAGPSEGRRAAAQLLSGTRLRAVATARAAAVGFPACHRFKIHEIHSLVILP